MKKLVLLFLIICIYSNLFAKKKGLNGFYAFKDNTNNKNYIQITKVAKKKYYFQLFVPNSIITYRCFLNYMNGQFQIDDETDEFINFLLILKSKKLYFFYKKDPSKQYRIKRVPLSEFESFVKDYSIYQSTKVKMHFNTDNIRGEFKQIRNKAQARSCKGNLMTIEGATEMYNMENKVQLVKYDPDKLIKGNCLTKQLNCKSGGKYSWSDGNSRCTVHGTVKDIND